MEFSEDGFSEESLRVTAMRINYDDKTNLYIMTFVDDRKEDRPIFEIKMPIQDFEKLTADMLKMVKNQNLQQAREYLEKKNESAT